MTAVDKTEEPRFLCPDIQDKGTLILWRAANNARKEGSGGYPSLLTPAQWPTNRVIAKIAAKPVAVSATRVHEPWEWASGRRSLAPM